MNRSIWLAVKEFQPVRRWFYELPLATKRITPCERVLKTLLENGVFSCVPFCLRSLGPFERCAKVYQRNWRRKDIFRVNTFAKTLTLEVQQYCPAPNTVAFVYPIHRFQFSLFLFSLWGSFIKPSSLILFSFACRHCPRANPELLLLHLLQRGVLALS